MADGAAKREPRPRLLQTTAVRPCQGGIGAG